MRCLRIKKLLPLLAGGELGPEDRQTVKDHLSRCPRCREAAEEYYALFELTRRIPPIETPDEVHNDLVRETMKRVRDDSDRAQRPIRRGLPPTGVQMRYVLASAAVVILIAATVTFFAIDSYRARHARGPTLQDYLERSDFRGLSAALSDERARAVLMKESVSVDLFIHAVERLSRMDSRHGHVRQHLARSFLEMKDGSIAPPRLVDSGASLKAICAGINSEEIHFESALRTLRWYRRSGGRMSLEDMMSVLGVCRET